LGSFPLRCPLTFPGLDAIGELEARWWLQAFLGIPPPPPPYSAPTWASFLLNSWLAAFLWLMFPSVTAPDEVFPPRVFCSSFLSYELPGIVEVFPAVRSGFTPFFPRADQPSFFSASSVYIFRCVRCHLRRGAPETVAASQVPSPSIPRLLGVV